MHRNVALIACRSRKGIQVLDQEQHAAKDGRRHIDFQIIRVGEVCWTIQALSDTAWGGPVNWTSDAQPFLPWMTLSFRIVGGNSGEDDLISKGVSQMRDAPIPGTGQIAS
jgi:hypothetical protein